MNDGTGQDLGDISRDPEDQQEAPANDTDDEEELRDEQSYFLSRTSGSKIRSILPEDEGLEPVGEPELGSTAAGLDQLRREQADCLFPRWVQLLECGANLLIVGFGSKKALLSEFAQSLQQQQLNVVVVNGYNPTVTVWALLLELIQLVPEPARGSFPPASAFNVRRIAAQLSKDLKNEVVIIVHSVDGPGLRSPESQTALSSLVSICPKLLLVASADNLNAPLLWHAKLWHQFDWCIVPVHTYESYTVERSFNPSSAPGAYLHGSAGGESERRRLDGAIMLLKGLNSNARRIFQFLGHIGKDGITERNLHELCREQFLANTIADLRSILTELDTHALIKWSRSDAGAKVCLTLEPAQVEHVLSALDDVQKT